MKILNENAWPKMGEIRRIIVKVDHGKTGKKAKEALKEFIEKCKEESNADDLTFPITKVKNKKIKE